MTVHARIRQLAQTGEGRAQLARWSGCETTHVQVAFEQAGDFANARLFELHRMAAPIPDTLTFGSHEWRRASEARSADIEAQVLAELEAL